MDTIFSPPILYLDGNLLNVSGLHLNAERTVFADNSASSQEDCSSPGSYSHSPSPTPHSPVLGPLDPILKPTEELSQSASDPFLPALIGLP